jgi:hypothetical protein
VAVEEETPLVRREVSVAAAQEEQPLQLTEPQILAAAVEELEQKALLFKVVQEALE